MPRLFFGKAAEVDAFEVKVINAGQFFIQKASLDLSVFNVRNVIKAGYFATRELEV